MNRVLIAAVIGGTLLCGSAAAQLAREEALRAAYPGASIHDERVFLTEPQRRRVAELARVDVPTPLVARYVAVKDGQVIGRAYVDTHVVRTKRETLLICLGSDGKVRRIEVTAFLEPREYLAPPAWYGQFGGRGLDDSLSLQRAIRPVAGATLTAGATTGAVRRVLAIDQVVGKEP